MRSAALLSAVGMAGCSIDALFPAIVDIPHSAIVLRMRIGMDRKPLMFASAPFSNQRWLLTFDMTATRDLAGLPSCFGYLAGTVFRQAHGAPGRLSQAMVFIGFYSRTFCSMNYAGHCYRQNSANSKTAEKAASRQLYRVMLIALIFYIMSQHP